MKADASLPAILIVDDNNDDAVLLARRLKDAAIKNGMLHFRTGGEAFIYLKQFCPPETPKAKLPLAMFLDVNMQGLSGFDVLLWARQQPALHAMKIFVLSGAKEEWDAQIAAKLGADEYLEKFPTAAALAGLLADKRANGPAFVAR